MTLNEQLEQTILRRRLRYIQKKDRLFSKRLQREYEDVSDRNSTVNTQLTLGAPGNTMLISDTKVDLDCVYVGFEIE